MNGNNWQQLLIARHPHLFVRNFRGHAFSAAYPICPDGWKEVVVTLADRVSEAAKRYRVKFCEISERCGQLRIYWMAESTLPKSVERRIEDAIARAEARSACSCATCGGEGRLFFTSGGRLLPLCAEHARGDPMPSRSGSENVHLVQEFVGKKPDTIARRMYDRRLDRFVDLDA